MDLIWKIDPDDAERIRQFVRSYRSTEFVINRHDRCIRGNRRNPTLSRFWKGLVLALLTTQQRSGPGSPVHRFLKLRPFPLAYARCRDQGRLSTTVERVLRSHGGIRRVDTIAAQLTEGMAILQSTEGSQVKAILKGLESHRGIGPERESARYLADTFTGLGPKQSRNLLQYLGLTRHEIPLDSRLIKWLNSNGFPLQLTAAGLSDPAYYEFVLDGVQALCKAAKVYPCIFDAAVFSSFDDGSWDAAALID